MTDKEMKTMIERIKNLIQFIESPDNAELSDGEVLDYTIDELKKLTDDVTDKETKEQFEYGELVEVRDHDNEEWRMYIYVGTTPNCRQHFTMRHMQDVTNFDGFLLRWNQIRKINDD